MSKIGQAGTEVWEVKGSAPESGAVFKLGVSWIQARFALRGFCPCCYGSPGVRSAQCGLRVASLGDSAGDPPVITGSIPSTKRIVALRAVARSTIRPRAPEKSDISHLITDESYTTRSLRSCEKSRLFVGKHSAHSRVVVGGAICC